MRLIFNVLKEVIPFVYFERLLVVVKAKSFLPIKKKTEKLHFQATKIQNKFHLRKNLSKLVHIHVQNT